MIYEWDETKRQQNLEKHGLDLIDGVMVYESPYKLEVQSNRNGEIRTQAIAYVFDRLTVLSLAYTERDEAVRLISLRSASKNERSAYHEWLATEDE